LCCLELGQCLRLARLLRRPGHSPVPGLPRCFDLIEARGEHAARAQDRVASRPELTGGRLTTDFGQRHSGPGESSLRGKILLGQRGPLPKPGELAA
jgi:hypothetical protein